MQAEIVIVDDDVIYNKILINSFKKIGCDNILSFSDGNYFLKYILSPDATLPKVIILDYNMPLLTGFQLLAYLKRNELFSNVKVIIYSAYGDESVERICLKAGAWSFIRKKEDLEELKKFCLEMVRLVRTDGVSAEGYKIRDAAKNVRLQSCLG